MSEVKVQQEYQSLKNKLADLQNRKGLLKNKMNVEASKEKLKKLKKESANYNTEITK